MEKYIIHTMNITELDEPNKNRKQKKGKKVFLILRFGGTTTQIKILKIKRTLITFFDFLLFSHFEWANFRVKWIRNFYCKQRWLVNSPVFALAIFFARKLNNSRVDKNNIFLLLRSIGTCIRRGGKYFHLQPEVAEYEINLGSPEPLFTLRTMT